MTQLRLLEHAGKGADFERIVETLDRALDLRAIVALYSTRRNVLASVHAGTTSS